MKNIIKPVCALLLVALVSGCATPANRKDPLEPLNRGIYQFNDAVDKAALKPLAIGYQTVVPEPFRMMARNFFSNLTDVIVAVNDLLQFKLVQATSDTGRVLVNTTVGLFGVADVASMVGLEKHNEDFGQTLGYWGMETGPYLVLPILGPSSFRDGIGVAVDGQFDPIWRTRRMQNRNVALFTKAVGTRADLLEAEKILNEAALDRYVFIREAYLQRRQGQVYDGNPPLEEDGFEDESDSPGDKPKSDGQAQ